jgi:hypothetical protein
VLIHIKYEYGTNNSIIFLKKKEQDIFNHEIVVIDLSYFCTYYMCVSFGPILIFFFSHVHFPCTFLIILKFLVTILIIEIFYAVIVNPTIKLGELRTKSNMLKLKTK